MAKIIVCNNIFDAEDVQSFEAENKSVKEFLYDINLDKKDCSNLVEVYDPDTGETSFVPFDDDGKRTLNVNINVNGKQVSDDYILQKTDLVVIQVLPASDVESAKTGLMIGGALTTILAIFAISVLTAGIGSVGAGAAATAAISSLGGMSVSTATHLAVAAGYVGLLGAGMFMAGLALNDATSNTTKAADDAEKLPEVSGSNNQSLVGNAIPIVTGKVSVSPFIIGNPYTELETGAVESQGVSAGVNVEISYVKKIDFSYDFWRALFEFGSMKLYGAISIIDLKAKLSEPQEKDCTITLVCTHPATVKYKYEVHRGHTVTYETREKYMAVTVTRTCVIKAGETYGEFTSSWEETLSSNNVDLVWGSEYKRVNGSWTLQPTAYQYQGSPTVNVSVVYDEEEPVTTTFELGAESSVYSEILSDISSKGGMKRITRTTTREYSITVPLQDTQPAVNIAKMFGETMSETLLLAVGYAPVFVKNITLDSLPIVKNKNNVLSGLMTYSSKEDGTVDSTTKYLTRHGVTATFNGEDELVETEAQWNVNKVSFEVSQFNQHRSLYPYVVKQQTVNSALLYCYDGKYEEVAQDHKISWQGGSFPVGMRTNTIYLSKSVPRKITVGIDFPSGLYRTCTKDGDNYYQKIPMNLVIQWRPYYTYTDKNNIDSDNGDNKVYDNKAASPDYTSAGRYGLWRNFDDNQIVPQITYISSKKLYTYYHINGQAVTNGAFFGKITSEEELETMPASFDNFVPVEAIPFLSGYNTAVEEFAELRAKQLGYITEEKKTVRLWYTLFIGTKTYITYNYDGYTTARQSECTEWAKAHIKSLQDNAESDYISRHENEEFSYEGETTSAKEIKLNEGLSEGTDTNSNPTWNGIKCFSFGKFSCGKTVYETDPSDPSLVNGTKKKNPVGCKDQMRFEVSATLTQEDILDLLNKNPKTIEAGKDSTNPVTYGMTDCVLDSVEVRVIRLTPCYIDAVKENSDKEKWTYSDVVKWSYLKTETLDKRAILDDIETSVEVSSETEEGSAVKIDCDPETYETSGTWNTWNIASYRQTPMPVSDLERMTTVGVKVYPDDVGYISGTLSKIGLDAYAITPALKQAHVRYWRHWLFNDGTEDIDQYAYYDSYDDFTNKAQFEETKYEYPVYRQDTLWNWATADEFNAADKTPLGDAGAEYFYERLAEPWEKRFYPEKVETMETLEPSLDVNGNLLKNELGETVMETVTQGNDWIDYISKVMSEHKDSLGRWIATDSFLATFTEQNAIAQALSLAVSPGLGKDAKGYNSTSHTKFVTYWKHDEDTGMYYKYDSDDIEPQDDVDGIEADASSLWRSTSEGDFNIADKTLIDDGILWSYRTVTGAFNMLALKEAYEYTDAINIGNGAVSYKSNNYIYQQKKFQDLLQQVLYNGRAFWFYDDIGRIEIHNDRKLKNPVLLITDENSISSSNTRSFAKSIAGYHVTFKDEKNGGQEGELYVLRNGQTKEHHTRDITELSLDGITNELQARDFALYMLAQSVVQRETWTRKLNHVGGSLTIGSLVEVQSSTLEIGTDTSGRIQRLITDGQKIYGFIADNTYIYQDEYNEDGSNVQGCTIMQLSPYAGINSRTVAMRFASQSQQENGITVPEHTEEGVLIPEIVYSNEAGATNLILLAKPIIIEDGRQENQTKDYDTKTYLYTVFRPSVGDVIAFGDVGKTTSPAIVSSLSPDESGHISVQMFPYYDEVYDAAHGLPIYSSNLSRKARSNAVPVPMEVTRGELQDTVQNIAGDIAADVSGIIDGTADVDVPDAVHNFRAYAEEKGIELTWTTSDDSGLKNSISYYEITLSINEGTPVPVGTATGGTFKYMFPANTYYEASDFNNWVFSITATNLYGKTSEETLAPVNPSRYLTWIPDKPVISKIDAYKDGITLVWGNNEGLYYGTKEYEVWYQRPDQNSFTYIATVPDSTYTYHFNRSTDGYPECIDFGGALDNWQFRVIAKNESSNRIMSDDEYVNTDHYGTWTLNAPSLSVKKSQRTLLLEISKSENSGVREIYGTVRARVQIKRMGFTYQYIPAGGTEPVTGTVTEDNAWYVPNLKGDPYSTGPNGDLEYRDTSDPDKQYLETTLGTFAMTVPLFGQQDVGIGMYTTPYKFNVQLFNEAHNSSWVMSDQVEADITDLRDFVKANKTVKQAVIEELTALAARLGEITDGSFAGNSNNYWVLSDKSSTSSDPKDYHGAFSVGDENQYIRVTPILDMEAGITDRVTGYKVEIKAGNIEFSGSTEGGSVSDQSTYIYNTNKTQRMAMSAEGIQMEVLTGTGWAVTGKVLITSEGNVTITNSNDTSNIQPIIAVDDNSLKIYHLNDSVFDQNGDDSENLLLSENSLVTSSAVYLKTPDSGFYNGPINKSISDLTSRDMVFYSKSSQLRTMDGANIKDIADLSTGTKLTDVSNWNDYIQANYAELGFTTVPSATLVKWN